MPLEGHKMLLYYFSFKHFTCENVCVFVFFGHLNGHLIEGYTVCPGSSDPFHIVKYYLKWVTTSWTHSSIKPLAQGT